MIDQNNEQTAPRVTPTNIEANIVSEHYFTAADGVDGSMQAPQGSDFEGRDNLRLVTFCVLVLKNGTKIVGINYGPVSPENFNAEQGRTEARANAIEQVWPLLGYALRDKLASNPTNFAPLTDEQRAMWRGCDVIARSAPAPDCPHAAPFRYCMQCVADPCPSGLGEQTMP